jgi:hypothetical protein
MASVSISLTVDQADVVNPENFLASTNAPGAGDIELRVNMAKFTSLRQIFLALENMDYFVNDANKGPNTFGVL